jgi:hypothetical protein
LTYWYFCRYQANYWQNITTPLETNYTQQIALAKNDPVAYITPINASYNEIVGKIMYAMVATRPDICAAVGIASRFLKAPTKTHWAFVIRILKYLNSTRDFGLVYKCNESSFIENTTPKIWVDADFANDPVQYRSISGFIMLLCNAPVIWYSKKQTTTAQSTAEAEFIAANICSRILLRHLLAE